MCVSRRMITPPTLNTSPHPKNRHYHVAGRLPSPGRGLSQSPRAFTVPASTCGASPTIHTNCELFAALRLDAPELWRRSARLVIIT